ncbi:MAG: DNA topoisomerase I, partial [Coriobacteriia bacterium]|nr:DNA topoisomerase I [Coriobacteriia bacterium]
MVLVVTEKNNAAQKIAELLNTAGKPVADKVYQTPIYRFKHKGEDWVTVGLRGHILAPDFPLKLQYAKRSGWNAIDKEGEISSTNIPSELDKPPFKKKKPFVEDGVELKAWKIESLPYLVWAPVIKEPAEKDIIRSLKNLAKKSEHIIIATDFDREGELIGSDALNMVLEVNTEAKISRARYSAITKGEIEHAFSNLVELDHDLASAGESRQHIDLIWGAVLTRYLTLAKFGGFGNVRSAGRVQTPTLALVAERERERQAFIPEDYWQIKGMMSAEDQSFKVSHKTARFKDKNQAESAFAKIKDEKTAQVINVEKKSRTQAVPAPFNTTSLQSAASAEGLSPARTMRIAESLYMNGYISYPRVDNTVYPKSLQLADTVKILSAVPQYRQYALDILKSPLHPSRGKQETTDHPPIHPVAAGDPDKMKPEEWKLYNLIARRFLATLGDPATIEGTKLSFDIKGEELLASGDVLVKPGFRAIYPFGLKKDETLPALEKGDIVQVESLDLEAKQTEPPARYSQGKLIQEMEKAGLGTKSTRHSIIERLYQVKYVKNDPIEPSQLGMAIIEALTKYAPKVTSPTMTSELESEMEQVALGNRTQEDVVNHSRLMLSGMLDDLIDHKDDLGEAISDAVTADARVGACPKCGNDLLMKHSPKTKSSFIGCSNWPDCDVVYPVPKGKIDPVDEPCPVCGKPQIMVRPFRQKAYTMCVDPLCPTNKEEDVIVGTCHVCAEEGRHGDLVAHKNERTLKRFIRCTNFELCGVSYPLPARGKIVATGETCPDCNAPIVEIQTERGPWRICVDMNC